MSTTVQGQKVAVVTGASQGIGAGVVAAYRKLGYGVVATSRSIRPSDDPGVLTVQGDIADPRTAERVIGQAVERFGRVDTLVNNAGVFVAKPFTDYTEDDFSYLVGVNLAGYFRITQLVIPHMLTAGAGHVVNITTSLVDHPHSGVPSVLASLTKGGLQAATKSLAIEYAGRGIRANAVSPGFIKTPLHPEANHATLASMLPVGRMGETSDVAEAVIFLENAPFVTGEILHVDGGQNAGH
jgi:NAD(P)-dependent dehydrogenase (short-subunit alcohol dehydrogenase family)